MSFAGLCVILKLQGWLGTAYIYSFIRETFLTTCTSKNVFEQVRIESKKLKLGY